MLLLLFSNPPVPGNLLQPLCVDGLIAIEETVYGQVTIQDCSDGAIAITAEVESFI